VCARSHNLAAATRCRPRYGPVNPSPTHATVPLCRPQRIHTLGRAPSYTHRVSFDTRSAHKVNLPENVFRQTILYRKEIETPPRHPQSAGKIWLSAALGRSQLSAGRGARRRPTSGHWISTRQESHTFIRPLQAPAAERNAHQGKLKDVHQHQGNRSSDRTRCNEHYPAIAHAERTLLRDFQWSLTRRSSTSLTLTQIPSPVMSDDDLMSEDKAEP